MLLLSFAAVSFAPLKASASDPSEKLTLNYEKTAGDGGRLWADAEDMVFDGIGYAIKGGCPGGAPTAAPARQQREQQAGA